jgi:hypothetical protein
MEYDIKKNFFSKLTSFDTVVLCHRYGHNQVTRETFILNLPDNLTKIYEDDIENVNLVVAFIWLATVQGDSSFTARAKTHF